MTNNLNWEMLIDSEPKLAALLEEIQASKIQPGACCEDPWYDLNGFKDRLVCLVGWIAERKNLPKFMKTSEAYTLAYGTL